MITPPEEALQLYRRGVESSEALGIPLSRLHVIYLGMRRSLGLKKEVFHQVFYWQGSQLSMADHGSDRAGIYLDFFTKCPFHVVRSKACWAFESDDDASQYRPLHSIDFQYDAKGAPWILISPGLHSRLTAR